MRKRMKLLGLLLAGSIAVGSSGLLYVEAAQRQVANGPYAGISGVVTGLLTEESMTASAEGTGKDTKESAQDSGGETLKRSAETQKQKEKEQTEDTQEGETSVHEVPVVESEFADIAIAQVNSYVNVRQEPNTESEVLGKLYNNSAATVSEATEDGWYRITSGNVEGYVKAEYVVVGDEELAKEAGTRFATVNTMTLFVRSEPTTESSVLTMVPEGDDLVVSDESVEGWAKVETVEGDGYVSTDYVEMSTEYIHAESKAEEAERLAREEAERQAAARAAEEARRAQQAAEDAKRAQEAQRQAEEAARRAAQSANSAGQNTNSVSSGHGSGAGGGTSNADVSSGGSTVGSTVSNGQAVVDYARQFLGNPYVYGGTSLTNGADCSGFVQSVYKAFGVSLPRNSTAQRGAGYAVSLSDIQPGDLVCYSGHIGIYAGNNTLIHASNERTGITTTSPVTYRPIIAVRRIF